MGVDPLRRGAALARAADAGGVVAVVLIVSADGGPGWLGGVLGACITAPHLLGPFVARPLDTAADGRRVIAVASLVHGAAAAAGALTAACGAGNLMGSAGVMIRPLRAEADRLMTRAASTPSRSSSQRWNAWSLAAGPMGSDGTFAAGAICSETRDRTSTVRPPLAGELVAVGVGDGFVRRRGSRRRRCASRPW